MASFAPGRRSRALEILAVAQLRLRFPKSGGLGRNQNLPPLDKHSIDVFFKRRCIPEDQLVRSGEELAVGQESGCQAAHGRRPDEHIHHDDLHAGHVGGDDFFVGIKGAPLDLVIGEVRQMAAKFRFNVESFYDSEAIQNGCIRARDREGRTGCFPLITVSAALLELPARVHRIYSPEEISHLMAEMKKEAKLSPDKMIAANLHHFDNAPPSRPGNNARPLSREPSGYPGRHRKEILQADRAAVLIRCGESRRRIAGLQSFHRQTPFGRAEGFKDSRGQGFKGVAVSPRPLDPVKNPYWPVRKTLWASCRKGTWAAVRCPRRCSRRHCTSI